MFVDRVVVLTLRRRADRLEDFLAQYRKSDREGLWPFPEVEVVYGVDGSRTGGPRGRVESVGSWGCRQTHLRAWEDALTDEVERVLVFEDDAVLGMLLDGKREDMFRFLEQVPEDWAMVYLGYILHGGRPFHVDGTDAVFTPGVGGLVNLQAYLLNRPSLSKLYRDLHSPGYPDTFRKEEVDPIDERIDQIRKNGGVKVYLPKVSLCDQNEQLEDFDLFFLGGRHTRIPITGDKYDQCVGVALNHAVVFSRDGARKVSPGRWFRRGRFRYRKGASGVGRGT
jgi:hypothetical protein